MFLVGHDGWHLGQCLLEGGEGGNHLVQAGQPEDTDNAAIGEQHQPQPAAFGQGPLVRPHRHCQPGRIAELGAGQIHHHGGVPAVGDLGPTGAAAWFAVRPRG
jgi:hypothetical protein